MAIYYSRQEIESALRTAFPIVTEEYWFTAKPGMRLVPMAGALLRVTDASDLIAGLRASLPADARLYDWDGAILRMRTGAGGVGSDTFCAIFASATWPAHEPGAWLDELIPIFHSDNPFPPIGDEPLKIQAHTVHMSQRDIHEFIVSKATHVLEIPRDRETEESLVIVIKPKGAK
jgi:hypothetical protein